MRETEDSTPMFELANATLEFLELLYWFDLSSHEDFHSYPRKQLVQLLDIVGRHYAR